jgi:putative alpha-1,2-mannosidase
MSFFIFSFSQIICEHSPLSLVINVSGGGRVSEHIVHICRKTRKKRKTNTTNESSFLQAYLYIYFLM